MSTHLGNIDSYGIECSWALISLGHYDVQNCVLCFGRDTKKWKTKKSSISFKAVVYSSTYSSISPG